MISDAITINCEKDIRVKVSKKKTNRKNEIQLCLVLSREMRWKKQHRHVGTKRNQWGYDVKQTIGAMVIFV